MFFMRLSIFFLKVILIFSLLAFRNDLNMESRNARIALECLVQELGTSNVLGKKYCGLRFETTYDSPKWSEIFLFSHNDPIEVFKFDGRYRIFDDKSRKGHFFILPPVLGGVRDRFIDQKPLGGTLLFTTTIAGLGVEYSFFIKILSSVSIDHIKQRYAGNFIHTDIPIYPKKNAEYGLDQAAIRGAIRMTVEPFSQTEFSLAYNTLVVPIHNQIHRDQEIFVDFVFLIPILADCELSLLAKFYARRNNLSRTKDLVDYTVSKIGVGLDF